MKMFNDLKGMLLTAPDTQLDACVFPYITKAKTADDIKEILDMCAFSALASGFVMTLLDQCWEDAKKNVDKVSEE